MAPFHDVFRQPQFLDDDFHHRLCHPKPGELLRHGLVQLRLLLVHGAREALPSLLDQPKVPQVQLFLQEADVIGRIIAQRRDRFPFLVDGAGGVNDVDQYVRLPQVVEELVAHALPLVRSRHQTSDVDHLHRDEARVLPAEPHARVALRAEVLVRAVHRDVPHS